MPTLAREPAPNLKHGACQRTNIRNINKLMIILYASMQETSGPFAGFARQNLPVGENCGKFVGGPNLALNFNSSLTETHPP
jgi:hypothetical protein